MDMTMNGNGKGDNRRPSFIDDEQFTQNWNQTFNPDSNDVRIQTTTRDNPDQEVSYGLNRRFNRR